MRAPAARCLALPLLAVLATPAFAAWPTSPLVNVPLCTADLHQYSPTAAPDGAGGAIVTWYDYRSGLGADVYAQHVLGSGAVDPAWPAGGRPVCTAQNQQAAPTIVSDGAGGAIIAWYDHRGLTNDIYAMHVMPSGALDAGWPVDGRALTLDVGEQSYPQLVTDGAGGAIVTWLDNRAINPDIYAQHVQAGGAVDVAWPANGRAICTATGYQETPQLVSDGAGGAIVTWQDARGGPTYDVYAQRVLASGAVDPAWPADGRALCTAIKSQVAPAIAADGAGGAIVTWEDYRVGFTADIYAQRVLATGAVDPAWPDSGLALCTQGDDQRYPVIVSDGTGGGIVTWQDQRPGVELDVYAQHVLVSGAVDPAWPPGGRGVCTATGSQYTPSITTDGAGGAVIGWIDYRSLVKADVYAQRVRATGAVDPAWPTGGQAICLDPADQFNVAIVTDGAGGAVLGWQDQRGGDDDIYSQRVAADGSLGAPVAGVIGGPAPDDLVFASPSPNPTALGVRLEYALPRASRVKLAVYDAAGRHVRTLEDGERAAGARTTLWDLRDEAGRLVGAGLYFARVEAGAVSTTRRIAITR